MSCRFFVKSDYAERCMNRNENLNNHCWSQNAQSLGLHSEEEAEIELDFVDAEEGWGLKDEKRTCLDCTHYTCQKLMTLAAGALNRGGLTYTDIEEIAGKCETYANSNKG